MAIRTAAYSSFSLHLREVELLRIRAAALERIDAVQQRDEINALCRGSVVLLSAKLEAYIKSLGELLLQELHSKAVSRSRLAPQFFYHLSKSAIEEVRSTTDPARVANGLMRFLQNEANFWGDGGTFVQPLPVENFNKGFSNPTVDKIAAYFRRFGYSDYKRDLGHRLKGNYAVTINMIDHIVDTRNKIAHGDPLASKPPADINQMVSIARSFCGTTDNIFAIWCRKKLCTIR